MTKRTSRRRTSSPKRRASPRIQISPDTQLDILGYGLLAIAVVTLLALPSFQRGLLLGPWIDLLRYVFGWGVYVVPFFLGAVGLYLILRRFGDRIPRPQPAQVAGVTIAFVALLTTVHFPVIWVTGLEPLDAVRAGYGGGYLGAGLGMLLVEGVGAVGTVLVLALIWFVAVLFTFGISPTDVIKKVGQWLQQVQWRRPTQLPLPFRREKPLAQPPSGVPAGRPTAARTAMSPSASAASSPLGSYALPRVVGGPPWHLPPLDAILEPGDEQDLDQEFMRQQARIIEETLTSLGAPVQVVEVNRGPVVTQFGIEPLLVANQRGKEMRVKVSKITSLQNDVALALSAKTIRVQAPIPRKGLIGIEVPNQEVSLVALRDIIESEKWQALDSPLRLGLGQDVSGAPFVADLQAMPHLLIAGTTGSGKSVCINALLAAMLLQNSPETLKFLMVDPKRVELTLYNDIPHLLAPVVVDMERVVGALKWVLREMDGRYRKFSRVGARDINDYNRRLVPQNADKEKMPFIVVVIDELADLMMLAPQETERSICRLAQMARATGIHLIIATQRPSVDVVTGLIKANFPTRIAFAVASSVDSRVILDSPGAERLLGRGDMLYMPPDAPQMIRLQGAFVSDLELHRLVRYWKGGRELEQPPPAEPRPTFAAPSQAVQLPLQEDIVAAAELFEDDLFPDALEVLLAEDRASISLLQRRLRIGYTRSARIMDLLAEKNAVGPNQPGGQAREVNRAVAEALLRQVGREWRPPG
ncbi:MAG: DNA translocase FtsK 4TM domain-containing protein [Anaerolineae bacterium]|nr:DNA translocase FtsK 4TM domain-containing protein [Anaerolineae bacterium]